MTNQDNKLRKLMAAGQVLAKYDSLEQLLPKLLRLSLEVTEAEAASILLYDPRKDVLRFASAINDVLEQEKIDLLSHGLELPMGQGVAGWVAEKRTALNVPDVKQDKRFAPVADSRSGFITKNILCVPVVHGNDLLGVAQVLNSKNKPHFDRADQDLLEAFADLAAVALSRSKMQLDTEITDASGEACWKTIGYLGDKTCQSLEKYIHCHNCPVFVQAGHSLFNRDLPDGYSKEWTNQLSQKKVQASCAYSSVAVFRINDEYFGLESKYFQGVFDVRPIRKLPHRTNNTFLGLSVVHGKIVPCISLSTLMGIAESNGQTENKTNIFKRFVFISREQEQFVIPVDEMSGIFRYESRHTQPVPDTVAKSSTTYTRAVINRNDLYIGLLEPDLFFNALQRSLK